MSFQGGFVAGVIATVALGGIATFFARGLVFPWLLDVARSKRQQQEHLESEARAHEREDAPVRARIHQALLTELEALRRAAAVRGQFSLEEWQAWHNDLQELVDTDSGARALGETFAEFKEALKYDQLSINIQTTKDSEYSAIVESWGFAGVGTDSHRRQQRSEYVAYREQNMASVLIRFAGLLATFDSEKAKEFNSIALQVKSRAETVLSNPAL